MAEKRYYVRRNDGSGAGAIFKTADEADRWVKANPNYVRESDEQREATQQEADQEVTDPAERERRERKGRVQADDKAVSAPAKTR